MLHRSQIAGRAPAGLKRLIGILKDWPDFPLPTAAVLEAWGQAAGKGRQLMIPLGQSAQGQWLKVPARALEDLARLLPEQTQDYLEHPPEKCPACERRLSGWDCLLCGYQSTNLERYIRATLAAMQPAQFLPFNTLLLPDPRRQRLIFLDLAQPGHVLWEVPLEESSRYPCYAQYLPEARILVADSKANRVLICDLLGRVCQSLDSRALALKEPVMATLLLTADGGRRYLVVDRAGHQVLLVNEDGSLHRRYDKDLSHPSFATVLPDQQLLICDTGHHRVLRLHAEHGAEGTPLSGPLQAPVWVQGLENHQLMVADRQLGRLMRFRADGLLLRTDSLHVMAEFNPHQLLLRHNGEVVIAQSEKIWALRPGSPHLSGFWEPEELICQELPVMVAKPILRAPRTARPTPPQSHPVASSLSQALEQAPLFARARQEVIEMACGLFKCQRVKAGQVLELDAQTELLYIAQGQFECLAGAYQASLKLYGTGSLLGARSLDDTGKLAGCRLRACVPGKIFGLNSFSLRTLLPFLEGQTQPLTPPPRPQSLSQRVRQLLSKPSHGPAMHHPLVRLNLYYTPAERQILTSIKNYRFRSFEIHLRFLPQGQALEEMVALFQLLKAHGSLLKHRWFDHGRLLVAHVLLNGIDKQPLNEQLATLHHIDRFWLVPLSFGPPEQEQPLLRLAGA